MLTLFRAAFITIVGGSAFRQKSRPVRQNVEQETGGSINKKSKLPKNT
jgi:hypothetical protein